MEPHADTSIRTLLLKSVPFGKEAIEAAFPSDAAGGVAATVMCVMAIPRQCLGGNQEQTCDLGGEWTGCLKIAPLLGARER